MGTIRVGAVNAAVISIEVLEEAFSYPSFFAQIFFNILN